MEITLLTETELKVSLTRDDMEHYSLDCASIDYDTTGTRRAFWSILDEARLKTGFDAAHDRIYIRLYPSRDGGCELYVTKLPEGKYADTDTDTERAEQPASRTAGEKNEYALYLLNIADAKTLISLCVTLTGLGFSEDNSLYVLRSGDDARRRFCLAVKRTPQTPDRGYFHEAFLAEYTERMLPSSAFSALAEHGVCLASHHAAADVAALAVPALAETKQKIKVPRKPRGKTRVRGSTSE